jgi:hypothetical protein
MGTSEKESILSADEHSGLFSTEDDTMSAEK